MKQVVASRTLEVPGDVKIEVKARKVRVTGDRGWFHTSLKLMLSLSPRKQRSEERCFVTVLETTQ